ncbi:MAG: polysaccharide biosynthesis tyrosine autokinase [Vicinamibacteria bacterium]|nr:polysaccharide biosynthesis tyrosine autokinase [Vicinamibacteria bacterium]
MSGELEPGGVGAEMGPEARYYLDLLWRSRALIVAGAAAGLLVGGFVAFVQTPEYQSEATLQIDPPMPAVMSVNEALLGGGTLWQYADFYNTQYQLLRSREIVDITLDRLKLHEHPPFKDAPDPTGLFSAGLAVAPVPETRLVKVQITHEDPKEAARRANALAEVYVERSLSSRVEAARRASDWIQERLLATQQSMREANEKLYSTASSADLVTPAGEPTALSSQLGKLTEDYMDSRARRITLEAALKQAADMKARGVGLESLPQVVGDVAANEIGQQIAAARIEQVRLREKYKEAHPEIQRRQSQIQDLERARAARAEQILEGLRTEYSQLQKREQELQGAMDAQRTQAAAQSRRTTEFDTLRKEASSAENLYEVLLQKLQETDIASSLRNSTVALVERARPAQEPIRPNKRRIAGIGLLAGLLLGVAAILLRDFFDNTIKSPEEVERFLRAELLAAVPRYDQESVHLVTEAYQALRTSLLFARSSERGQVVLVTGTAPQEGKTTTLINVGKLLASSGEKTLAIDCDLRRAQLHTRLGLPRDPGLSDHFVRHEPLDNLIRATRVPNLFVLTSGQLPPNPPALLARRSMAELLDGLRDRFDWILLDSPPLASVTDALLLARHADMVVFVVHHNQVDKHVIRRALGSLRRAADNLLGVVLNGVSTRTRGDYYYYYYQNAPGEDEKRAVETDSGPVEGAPAARKASRRTAKPEAGQPT